MRIRSLIGMFAVAVAASTGAAHATGVAGQGTWETTLQGRDLDRDGLVDAFYDTESNLTWLRDANINGSMTWATANTWATNLLFGGSDDWRLPNALDSTGARCGGYHCVGSEMGHLWLKVLGNLDETVYNGNSASVNTGGFSNFAGYYWTNSGTEGDRSTYFLTSKGYQYEAQGILEFHAMAVRSGDVLAVPEPASFILFLTGLIGFAAVARRRYSN